MIESLINVQSSNVEAVGYDSGTSELYVRFRNGSAYKYSGVPKTVYDGIFKAESVGRYLNESIRGLYSYTRLTEA